MLCEFWVFPFWLVVPSTVASTMWKLAAVLSDHPRSPPCSNSLKPQSGQPWGISNFFFFFFGWKQQKYSSFQISLLFSFAYPLMSLKQYYPSKTTLAFWMSSFLRVLQHYYDFTYVRATFPSRLVEYANYHVRDYNLKGAVCFSDAGNWTQDLVHP